TCGSLPVIALCNGTPHKTAGKGAFQELDSLALMRPVTKWAERPTDPAKLPWVMQRAFALAVNGRPGAVFIDIPSDIGLVETEMPDYATAPGRLRSRPEPQATAAAAALLADAKRPVFICGSGAVSANATAALTA